MKIKLNANSHFGAQLRLIREQKDISQVHLAKLMGCHSTNISHFEMGDNTFGNGSIKTVFKYAKALGAKSVIFEL